MRAITGVDAERVDLALATERVGKLAVERLALQRLEYRRMLARRVALQILRVDGPSFAVRRDRHYLQPNPAHLHVGKSGKDQTARRNVTAFQILFAPRLQRLMIRGIAA